MKNEIHVMSKGQIQETKVNNSYIVNYFDYTAQSLVAVQKYALGKNQTIIDASEENKILEVEINDVEITPENIKQAKKNKDGFPLRLSNPLDAKRVIDFLEENKNNNFIFQCDFGKSRSLTTAYFAKRYILTDHKFNHRNIYIHNKSLFRILMKVYLFPLKYK